MRLPLARCASILLHPLLLMPTAAIGVAISRNAPAELVRSLSLILAAVVVAALGFSIWNVWSGRWRHIDASNRSERRALNVFLAVILLTVSALTWRCYPANELAIGFLMSGLAVIVALALSPALKVSLHACFAVIAAGLLWPNLLLVAVGAFVVAALAWSRVVLQRHTAVEVLVGSLMGVGSAVGYHALVG